MSDTEQSGEELVDVGPQPRRYTEAEVREMVAKMAERMINAFDDEYCKHDDPLIGIIRTRKALSRFPDDIRSGKEPL